MLSLVHRQSSCILVSPQLFICCMEISAPSLILQAHTGHCLVPSFSKCAPVAGSDPAVPGAANFQYVHLSLHLHVVVGFTAEEMGNCRFPMPTSVPSFIIKVSAVSLSHSDFQLGRDTWKMQRNADCDLFCSCGVPSTVGSYSVAAVCLITQIITV